jgi:hypothetical protein
VIGAGGRREVQRSQELAAGACAAVGEQADKLERTGSPSVRRIVARSNASTEGWAIFSRGATGADTTLMI